MFQTVWTASPSSLSFIQGGETKNITLNTSYSWTASVSGTGFSLSTTSGTAGTHTIGVIHLSNSSGVRTGTRYNIMIKVKLTTQFHYHKQEQILI